MPGSKEIRTKIKSVQNTRKITKAMEMVAASKMRKAQERMRAARPYSEKIRRLAANISQANVTEYRHAFLSRGEMAEVKRVGLIVVTTDKGLCGGLNTNVLRQALSSMRQWQAGGVTDIQVTCIGNKGLGFMQRAGAKVISHVTHLGDTPHLDKLVGPVKVMIDAFRNGELDAVHLAYTRFINTMKQEPVIEPLLPLETQSAVWAGGFAVLGGLKVFGIVGLLVGPAVFAAAWSLLALFRDSAQEAGDRPADGGPATA